MRSDAETVDQYMEELPEDRRAALSIIRALIRKAAPDAAESMQYGMPTYELNGPLFAFASQKHYMSLYVTDTDLLDEFRPRLTGLDVARSRRMIRCHRPWSKRASLSTSPRSPWNGATTSPGTIDPCSMAAARSDE